MVDSAFFEAQNGRISCDHKKLAPIPELHYSKTGFHMGGRPDL
jgi:hypothetical protein